MLHTFHTYTYIARMGEENMWWAEGSQKSWCGLWVAYGAQVKGWTYGGERMDLVVSYSLAIVRHATAHTSNNSNSKIYSGVERIIDLEAANAFVPSVHFWGSRRLWEMHGLKRQARDGEMVNFPTNFIVLCIKINVFYCKYIFGFHNTIIHKMHVV